MLVRAFLSCCILLSSISPVLADEAKSVRVEVLDSRAHAVVGAHVFYREGSESVWHDAGATQPDGALVITVPPNAVLEARGLGIISDTIVASADSLVLYLKPKTIASVSAHTSELRSTSAVALVSGSLENSLRLQPGYRSKTEGGSGQISVDGIPLSLPGDNGGIAGASGYDTELFQSVNPSSQDSKGTPNYQLVSPTQDKIQTLGLTLGSNDKMSALVTSSGLAGRLGYGFSFLRHQDDGLLAGERLTDVSGLAYDHSLDQNLYAGTAQLQYHAGQNTYGFTDVRQVASGAYIQDVNPGGELLGYGPGTSTRSLNSMHWFTASHSDPKVSALFVDAVFTGNGAIDAQQALFQRQPLPFFFSYDYSGAYRTLRFNRVLDETTAVYLQASSQTFRIGNASAVQSSGVASSDTNLALGANITRGSWDIVAEAGPETDSGALGAAIPRVNLSASVFRHADRYDLSYQHRGFQDNAALAAGSEIYGSPQTANINCDAGTASLSAPSDLDGKHPVEDVATFTAALSPRRFGAVTFSATEAIEHDVLVQDLAEQPSGLPQDFVSELLPIFQASCGKIPLQSDQIYAVRGVQLPAVRSSEAYLQDKVELGPMTLAAFYEVLSQYSLTTWGNGGITSIIANGQLPGVPLHRANALLSFSRGSAEYAIDALYEAANNDLYLPGHIELMGGVAFRLQHGQLSISAQNPFGTYSKSFISPQYAVGIPLTEGAYMPLAQPLQRNYQVRYDLKVGRVSGS